MKKNLNLLIACLAIILAGSQVSCKKVNKGSIPEASPELKILSAKAGGFRDLPILENGMLVFRDDEHYLSYLRFLDKVVEGIDSTDSVNNENSILQEIEGGLNFISLRNITHAVYERQNAIGFPSLEAACEEHFINDADIRSTLNKDLNVRIGNFVQHQINKDFAVRVNLEDKELLQKYMSLKPEATLDDIWDVDLKKVNSTIYELTGVNRVFGGVDLTPLGDKNIVLPKYSIRDRCKNPYHVDFSDLAYVESPKKRLDSRYKVSFGDNTSEESYTGTGHSVLDFSHNYPGPGAYTVTIKACPNLNFAPNETKIKTMVVYVLTGATCARVFKESDWRYKEYKTNYFLGAKLRMQDAGSQGLRVVAYTKLIKKTSSGVYKEFWGLMYATMNGEAKDNNCNFNHYVSGSMLSFGGSQALHRTPGTQANVGQSTDYWSHYTSSHYAIENHNIAAAITIDMYPCE